MNCIFQVNKNTNDFCILTLYTANFLKALIIFVCVCVCVPQDFPNTKRCHLQIEIILYLSAQSGYVIFPPYLVNLVLLLVMELFGIYLTLSQY